MKRALTALALVLACGCTAEQVAALKRDEAIVAADLRTGAAVLLGLVNAAESNAATLEEIGSAIDAYAKAKGSDPQLVTKLRAALASKDLYTLKALLVIVVGTPPASGQ